MSEYRPWWDRNLLKWVMAEMTEAGYRKVNAFTFESREECEKTCKTLNEYRARKAAALARNQVIRTNPN